MNYLELTHIVQRLAFDLLDARLEQIVDGDCRLQFAFKVDEEDRRRFFLIVDFLPAHLDIYPTTHPRKAPAQPQAFTMLLRKYIANSQLTAARIADDDRIVTLEFGFEGTPYYEFIAELTGRTPHIFLVESQSRQILGRVGEEDPRAIHTPYVPPEPHAARECADRFEGIAREDLYAALDGEFCARDEKERVEAMRTSALKRIDRSLQKTTRLVQSLSCDLLRAEEAQRDRVEADLLNAYAYRLKQGMHTAELPDFETGDMTRIALDPALSIRENIEKKYALAKRMARSREQIKPRLDNAERRKADLERLRDAVASAKDTSPILELADAIDAACGGETTAKQKPKRTEHVAVHRPYKTFTSADGTTILVGKSAKDNDDLTLHHTRGNDYWLHVSGVPGSHVVVKSASPSQETLIDAALLAMHYSKLARADSAEVHVTQAKYVRKPKGAPDGKVEIRGEKSMITRQAEKRLARLMATEK